MFKVIKIHFLFFILIFSNISGKAQCGTVISTFPYTENFEAAPSWTSGGTNSDWAWGAPTHPIINSAGGGTKCWTVGGLSGSFYNYSELSWIMSPCFDFSTLNYPWISFKIFWEDEFKYDGMVLQYSLTGGTTWINVGAYGDAVNCLNDNWYNYNNITWLTSSSPKHGWTGRTGATSGSCQGGNGSLGWVTAKHCMSSLAGQANVRFRFLFGSGTTCNSYDGISVDDIFIGDAAPNVANFSYACAVANTVNFTNTSLMCPTGYLWDFGDGTTSTATSPSHTFSGPGTYNVMLTASGPCNASGSITIPVSILGATTTISNVTCNGANNGVANATALGSVGPFIYFWAPGGGSSSSISGLSAGTYTVSVSAAGACPATATAIITEPIVLSASTTVTPVSCFGGANGTSATTANGGTLPYSYSWSSGGTSSSNTGLSAGTYTVTISDLNSCTTTATAIIIQPATPLSITSSFSPVSCFGGSNGTANAIAAGGTSPYSYLWTPSGATTSNASGLIAGTYTVTVTDAHLCIANSSISITQPISALNATTSNTSSICGLSDGGATVSPTGGTMPYSYSWLPTGGTGTTATGLAPGTYTITVSDANNCSIPVTTTITSTGNIVASITTSPIICYGQANGTAMASVAGGSGPYTYLWSSGATTNSITNIASGAYCVTIIDFNGCRDTACVDLYDPPAINADFTSNTSVTTIYDPEIFFYDQTAGSTTWQWDFGDASGSSASNPIHNFGGEGTFPVTLFVSNSQGCTDTVTHYITINDGYTFYAPNAFTPDNNGENDIFLPKGTGWDISRFDMMIFDRWGNVVFHSTDVRSGWNGSLNNDHETAQADVYVWKVQV